MPDAEQETEGTVRREYTRPGTGPLPAGGGHSRKETAVRPGGGTGPLSPMVASGGGPDGGYDVAELVRRALHAAASQVEPSPDGLDRIHEKIHGPAGSAEPRDLAAGGGPLPAGCHQAAPGGPRSAGASPELTGPAEGDKVTPIASN